MKPAENLLLGIIVLVIALVVGGVIYLRFIIPTDIPRTTRPIIAPEITPSTETSPSKVNTDKETSYISCGCGCCPFNEPIEDIAKDFCLYKSKGETIEQKILEDKNPKPELCKLVGCAMPVRYIYCD